MADNRVGSQSHHAALLTNIDRYYHWVIAYVLGAGVVSFAVIYRLGPPSNPRTLNLIQWAMQLAGLATIVLSSYYQVERPMRTFFYRL